MSSEPYPKLLGARGEPIVKGSETIWEIVNAEDGFGFGLALVRIEDAWNEPHFHKRTGEVYTVVCGRIELRLGMASGLPRKPRPIWRATNRFLGIGQTLEIRAQQAHQARAHGGSHAWFYVYTFPAFDPADYHVLR